MKKRFLSMILAVVLCGLLLAGCDGGGSTGTVPPAPEAPAVSAGVVSIKLLGASWETATPMSITVLSFPMETQRLPERVRSPSLQEMLKAMFWMFPTTIPEELPEMIQSGSVEG